MVFWAKINDELSNANFLRLEGKLDLADKGGAYRTLVNVEEKPPGKSVGMRIYGWSKDTPAWARRLPFDVEMARVGDAVCQPAPTS
jgi:hypothetical protein